jgi:hypothetical protein
MFLFYVLGRNPHAFVFATGLISHFAAVDMTSLRRARALSSCRSLLLWVKASLTCSDVSL